MDLKWFVVIIGIRVEDYIHQGEEKKTLFKQEVYPGIFIILWKVSAALLELAAFSNINLWRILEIVHQV